MSKSDSQGRDWGFYLDDMITFAERVQAYTDGFDQAAFVADRLTYDATLRNLELIGEAARHLPDDVRTAHPETPWRLIIATRNRLIHGYLGIDDDTVWSIIQDEIPGLLKTLREIEQRAGRVITPPAHARPRFSFGYHRTSLSALSRLRVVPT